MNWTVFSFYTIWPYRAAFSAKLFMHLGSKQAIVFIAFKICGIVERIYTYIHVTRVIFYSKLDILLLYKYIYIYVFSKSTT